MYCTSVNSCICTGGDADGVGVDCVLDAAVPNLLSDTILIVLSLNLSCTSKVITLNSTGNTSVVLETSRLASYIVIIAAVLSYLHSFLCLA